MVCENCGAEIVGNDRICTSCGSVAVRSLMRDRSENVIGFDRQREIEKHTGHNNYTLPKADVESLHCGKDVSQPFAAQAKGEYKYSGPGEVVIGKEAQSVSTYVTKNDDSFADSQNFVSQPISSTPFRNIDTHFSKEKQSVLHSQYTPEGFIPPPNLTKREFCGLNELDACRNKIFPAIIILYFQCAMLLISVVFLSMSLWGLLEVAFITALTFGIQFKFSRACAVVLCVYSVLRILISLLLGYWGGWLLFLAGIFAVAGTFKFDKLWNYYQATGMIQKHQTK